MVIRLTTIKAKTYQGRGRPARRALVTWRSLTVWLCTCGQGHTHHHKRRGIMTDQTTLFDDIGDIRLDRPHHSCTGLLCTYCERFDREDTQLLANIDPQWRILATIYRKTIAIGGLLTADDLIFEIGKPAGHPNQIGALFRAWASQGMIESQGNYITSTRESNNGRTIKVWRRTA